MASPTTTRNLNIYIDNSQAEKALDKLKLKAGQLENKIDEIGRSGGDATRSMQRLAQTKDQIKTLENTLSKGLNKSLRDLRNQLYQTRRQLERVTDPTDQERLRKVYNSLTDQVEKYKKELYKVDTAQQKLKKTFRGIGASLKETLLFGGVAGAISAVTGQVINLARQSFHLALEAQGVKQAFNRLNDPGLLKELRKATRGTVSDLQLMETAVKAADFKIPLEQLSKYLKFAHLRARATGQSVDYLVESIIVGIGRKSPLILDNLGIGLVQLRAEMNKGATVAEAVGNIIEKSYGKAGASIDLAADKLDRLQAKAKNFQTGIGKALLYIQAFFVDMADLIRNPFPSGDDPEFVERLSIIQRKFYAATHQLDIQRQKTIDKFVKASDVGRKKILDNIDRFIAVAEKSEKRYRQRGLISFANYFSQIKKGYQGLRATLDQEGATGKSLRKLQEELAIAQQQQLSATTHKKYLGFQKTIDEIQADIDKITGKKVQANKQANSRIKADQERLASDLKRINDDLDHYYDNEIQKRLHAIEQKYERERELAHNNAELLKQIEETKNRELLIIQQDYLQKANEALQKGRTTIADIIGKPVTDFSEQMGKDVLKGLAGAIAKYGNGTSVADGNDFLSKIEKTFINIATHVRNAMQLYSTFDQLVTNSEQAALARDQAINDQKKQQFAEQLRYKLITQQDYNAKVAKLDEEYNKKRLAIQKKEFNRQKQLQAVQTTIAGARAAIQAYATLGPIAGAIAAALIAGITAAEVGFIEAQKPPSFGEGGQLHGPKHSSRHKGMPVIDPETGRVNAYLEGREGVLKASAMGDNRVYHVTGTPSQIASSLNSAYGGVNWESGASLRPAWMNAPYMGINAGRLLKTYGQGGVFDGKRQEEGAEGSATQAQIKLMKEQNELLKQQNKLLSHPSRAYVVLNDLNEQQKRLSDILDDATMR